MIKACFASVVFPANLGYFDEYLKSLIEQSYSDFDLLLFNDGVDNLEELMANGPFKDKRYKIISVSGTPAQIRSQALMKIIDLNYTHCVFGDTDDYFASNRIQDSIDKLEEGADVTFCDLDIVDSCKKSITEKYYSKRLQNGFKPDLDFLLEKNVCGLGNTAVKVRSLPVDLDFPVSIMAVDWLLYTRMILEGKKIVFSNQTSIYYRQHADNAIGLAELSPERIRKGIQVKYAHYKSLSDKNELLQELFTKIQKMFVFLDDQLAFEKYYSQIKSSPVHHPFWWEEITIID